MTTSADLPPDVPGAREPDEQLGLDELERVRRAIGDGLDATQGAWARQPAGRRHAPLAAAVATSLAWLAWCVVRGGVDVSALVGVLAGAALLVAVARAPLSPARGERLALAGLAVSAVAIAVEIAMNAMRPPVEGGTDVACATAICAVAVLPAGLLAFGLWRARMPARLLHVAAVAGAAFAWSAAAVWAECPGSALGHVARAHVLAPLVVAGLAVLALRPLLRGARVSL